MTTNQNKIQVPVDPLTLGELITLQQATEYAGLEKGTLHNYAKSGRIKAKKIGLYWVTTKAVIDEYIGSRKTRRPPKKALEK